MASEDQELERNWIAEKMLPIMHKKFDANHKLTIAIVLKEKERVLYGNEDDLWDIVSLDIEFHSLVNKKDYVQRFYAELHIDDPIVTEYFKNQNTASIAKQKAPHAPR
ncbi:BFH_collapsed_G0021130.mRNA.1.CDS.1 [Saccharomyces cerevisiae]|nr:BFH_collapsed_G0021130.mRNA.1.CDS.1 [Saccharomyces cerevisiae]